MKQIKKKKKESLNFLLNRSPGNQGRRSRFVTLKENERLKIGGDKDYKEARMVPKGDRMYITEIQGEWNGFDCAKVEWNLKGIGDGRMS